MANYYLLLMEVAEGEGLALNNYKRFLGKVSHISIIIFSEFLKTGYHITLDNAIK